MNKIEFVDQTIRDGQQSLWGFTMRTDHIAPIAETMEIATVQTYVSRSSESIAEDELFCARAM